LDKDLNYSILVMAGNEYTHIQVSNLLAGKVPSEKKLTVYPRSFLRY